MKHLDCISSVKPMKAAVLVLPPLNFPDCFDEEDITLSGLICLLPWKAANFVGYVFDTVWGIAWGIAYPGV